MSFKFAKTLLLQLSSVVVHFTSKLQLQDFPYSQLHYFSYIKFKRYRKGALCIPKTRLCCIEKIIQYDSASIFWMDQRLLKACILNPDPDINTLHYINPSVFQVIVTKQVDYISYHDDKNFSYRYQLKFSFD